MISIADVKSTLQSTDDSGERPATEADVRRLLDDVDATCIVEILLIKPCLCELEEAVLWHRGDAYLLGRRTLDDKAKRIAEILSAGRRSVS